MSYLPLIVIGIIVALVVFVIERRLEARKQPKPHVLLQDWGRQVLTEPAARRWLADRSPKEMKALLRHMRRFGKRENFDVYMLLQDKFGNDEELKKRATAVMTDYLHAVWQRADMQEDLHAHLFFAAYQKQPKRRKYRNFNLDLYVRLIQAGLVQTPSLTDSIMASEKKQQKTAQTAILQTADRHRPAFNQELKSTLKAQAESKSDTDQAASTQTTAPLSEAMTASA
ncbi:MAG: hypothetical protein H6668_09490 [Ardenticatenaceae bacterium]|nr:hypothetical protein [Ardenticatenaceae bacterium]